MLCAAFTLGLLRRGNGAALGVGQGQASPSSVAFSAWTEHGEDGGVSLEEAGAGPGESGPSRGGDH